MKNCQNCMAPIEDDAKFCTACGAPQAATGSNEAAPMAAPAATTSASVVSDGSKVGAEESRQGTASNGGQGGQPYAAPQQSAPANGYAPYSQQSYQQPYVASYDVNDHTAQFDPQDISDNKIYAMLCYLLSFVGIIVALLAAPRSPYCQFHLRQSVKFLILETITALVCALFFWTIIIPLLACIFSLVLAVLQLVCFFQVCGGKAKDAPIIRSCSFMK